MNDQIEALNTNKWIRDCKGAWVSMILFAPKPHQEDKVDIKDFVWRLCVSYRGLNRVTKSFMFPIPRCSDSIEDFGDSNGIMSFITLDARQGYHQISVRYCDQEKLAFFTPNGSKKTSVVIPFGPKNAPSFYTAMMKDFQREWNTDFNSQATIDPPNPPIKNSPAVDVKVLHGTKIVIDDILLYSTNVFTLICYLSCVARVFVRHRLSFKLNKCKFFEPRVEYLGYDLTSSGNCPAKSKFNMITN